MLWIVLTLMTSAAAVWLAAPFLRRLDERAAARASELEVYRDQLAEVERERADGAIDADQADAAALEIKRRLLNAARSEASGEVGLSLGGRHLAVAGVVGVVVLGSTILYSNLGRPDLPSVARAPTSLVLGDGSQGSTFQSRRSGSGTAGAPGVPLAREAPAAGTGTEAVSGGPPSTAAQGAGGPGLGSVDDMIQRLVDRLQKDPNSVETWRMLGWSYFATDRYPQAVEAYRKALALEPQNAQLLASLAEALVREANGTIRPDAAALVEQTLAIDRTEPRARFFKGQLLEQSGNKQAALDNWLALLADARPEDAWATELRQRVEALATEIGPAALAKLPHTAPAPPTGQGAVATGPAGTSSGAPRDRGQLATAPPAARGPTPDAVKAADAMTPADRAAMIRGMVDGLAARLETSPRDVDGWIQLMRSRKVLGEGDAARAALVKALAVFNDAPDERARIKAAGIELGIAP